MSISIKNMILRTEGGRRLRNVVRSCRGDNMLADHEILNSIPIFMANSTGANSVIASLALTSAQQTFPFMADALTDAGISLPPARKIVEIFHETDSLADTRDLGACFNKHGSDKASLHDYHRFYGPLLAANRNKPLRLLEVGLGSHNADIASNMGPIGGKPGASLRAFREFLPNALIFGADIDRAILFREERIKTVFVDQTKPETFAELLALGNDFDVVIDDGLHSPDANLATMSFALRSLKPGGVFVIEDIPARSVPVWQIMSVLLRAYAPALIEAKNGYLFKMTKPLAN